MTRLPAAIGFARMAGSSIASPAAAGWVTDFLNAAYYARPAAARDVADLRLAHGIVATRWAARGGGRLGLRDLAAMHRAYGALRLRAKGRLDRHALLTGAQRLLGEWFAEAWADPLRRAHGIAFETVESRRAYLPERRLDHGALGALTPPASSPSRLCWATYDPVRLDDPDAALAFLLAPERWPDMGSSIGSFTAVRSGGLEGQTFEIEIVADPLPRAPVITRGYVTCTALHRGAGLADAVSNLEARYRAAAPDDATLLASDAMPIALVILTTHDGHFLGRALSHLLVWRDEDGAWIRDVGAWDPLPPHLSAVYAAAGKVAQHQFWGPGPAERSMLAQLALATARR